MKNILWISFRVPYDNVAHAGGKVHNYYLKGLNKNTKNKIKLISFFNERDIGKIDLDRYNIDSILINSTGIEKVTFLKKIINKIYSFCPYSLYIDYTSSLMCKEALKKIINLKKAGYSPSVVILQWTQMVALLPVLKKIFPDSKYICIEEDVTYLSAHRRTEQKKKSQLMYYICRMQESKIKSIEKKCLENSDLTIFSNKKDYDLVIKDGFKVNGWAWTPYFDNFSKIKRNCSNRKRILFYGAMDRYENWKSAVWFIENVFCELSEYGFEFVVIGNRPNDELKKYHDGKTIIVTGFVEDVSSWFSSSLCLVAPLILGAGVKIKILEALSSGIPVITNDIGIEGIRAVAGVDYIHCDNPKDYVEAILNISTNNSLVNYLEHNGRTFIINNYNYEKDLVRFTNLVENYCAGKK